MPPKSSNTILYGRFLLFIAGLGGLLYGIDVGIITDALLYLNKTISLTLQQTSLLVAAVFGGGMLSSLVAGVLADWFGRKTMMIVSGLMFVSSVGIIVLSQGFIPLLLGRILQGLSVGIIAVVVPLYLAECLSAKHRGQGTAIFQFALTFGIVIAAVTGFFYTRQAEAALAAANGSKALIFQADNHAWRGMFLSIIYPGTVFFIGTFFLSESPRWLVRRGKIAEAKTALLRAVSPAEAELELAEMQALSVENKRETAASGGFTSLLRRKYVIPFALACIVLSLNQTTGINSVIGYLTVILKQAGMSAGHATQGDVVVKVLNCVMTLVGVALVDRKGRKFLLNLGTAGIVLAFLAAGLVFYQFESKRVDVLARVQSAVQNNALTIPVKDVTTASPDNWPGSTQAASVLTVLYDQGEGNKVATALSNDADPTIRIPAPTKPNAHLTIVRAQYGQVPSETTGWLITACLCLFITSYSFGPGVVVWLMLSELMPTRIRALGMGIALLLNQGISTLIAGVFLPVVGNHGYFAMFFFWAGCTVLYFLTSAFLLPETKGKSLEEIEIYFDKGATKLPA